MRAYFLVFEAVYTHVMIALFVSGISPRWKSTLFLPASSSIAGDHLWQFCRLEWRHFGLTLQWTLLQNRMLHGVRCLVSGVVAAPAAVGHAFGAGVVAVQLVFVRLGLRLLSLVQPCLLQLSPGPSCLVRLFVRLPSCQPAPYPTYRLCPVLS